MPIEILDVQRTEDRGDLGTGLLRVQDIALLSREEEIELAKLVREGDDAARERMIRANLRLVMKIARDYEHLGLAYADLVSEGIIGLTKAVERFNPAKGAKLSSYASLWIKQQIRRAVANQGRTIRLPVHVEAKLYRLGRAEVKLRGLLGREASDEELAAELGMSLKKVVRLRCASQRATSLDAQIGEDDGGTLIELVPDESAPCPGSECESKESHALLNRLMSSLSAREAEILTHRFGLNGEDEETLEEVGTRMRLTRERIRQIQNEAFQKLRAMMESPALQQEAA